MVTLVRDTRLIWVLSITHCPGVQSKHGQSTQYGDILHCIDSPVDWRVPLTAGRIREKLYLCLMIRNGFVYVDKYAK